jgi:hypothetical protein
LVEPVPLGGSEVLVLPAHEQPVVGHRVDVHELHGAATELLQPIGEQVDLVPALVQHLDERHVLVMDRLAVHSRAVEGVPVRGPGRQVTVVVQPSVALGAVADDTVDVARDDAHQHSLTAATGPKPSTTTVNVRSPEADE